MTTMWRLAAKCRPRKPARRATKARNMSCRTATSCCSSSTRDRAIQSVVMIGLVAAFSKRMRQGCSRMGRRCRPSVRLASAGPPPSISVSGGRCMRFHVVRDLILPPGPPSIILHCFSRGSFSLGGEMPAGSAPASSITFVMIGSRVRVTQAAPRYSNKTKYMQERNQSEPTLSGGRITTRSNLDHPGALLSCQ